jgi:hypothetical protein
VMDGIADTARANFGADHTRQAMGSRYPKCLYHKNWGHLPGCYLRRVPNHPFFESSADPGQRDALAR